ncbi:TolB family protein [Streptosporangium sp. NPDC000095]|uniref:TolB family protein n=1 Tax=Streptosporangium sp. NPDC000095 TaxID=3366184 RepID=UPI00368464AF
MTDIEERLSRSLGRMAERAPRLAPSAAERLETGHRRRRSRSQTLLAAATIVAVAGGMTVALQGGDDGRAVTVADHPSGRPFVEIDTIVEPVEKVWPQAVWKIPAKDPEGRRLRPIALTDDQNLLVEALSEAMRPEVLYLYDLTGGDLRKITDIRAPGNAANIGLGESMVAWSTSTKTSVRLWAVPLTGGEARQVAEHRTGGDTIDGLAVAKGAIVFSVRKGGVFSVPVDGGRVTPLDHGTGLHLLSWPWAGSPGTWSPQDGADGAPFTHLVNLETGQTDDAAPARQGQQLLACGVQSCISTTPGGARAFTRSRDGSTQQEVPPGFHIPEPPSQSRFYARNLRDDAPGLGLYDMKTGKLAAFDSGNDGTQGGVPVADRAGRMMTYLTVEGRYVIDLSRIP